MRERNKEEEEEEGGKERFYSWVSLGRGTFLCPRSTDSDWRNLKPALSRVVGSSWSKNSPSADPKRKQSREGNQDTGGITGDSVRIIFTLVLTLQAVKGELHGTSKEQVGTGLQYWWPPGQQNG